MLQFFFFHFLKNLVLFVMVWQEELVSIFGVLICYVLKMIVRIGVVLELCGVIICLESFLLLDLQPLFGAAAEKGLEVPGVNGLRLYKEAFLLDLYGN